MNTLKKTLALMATLVMATTAFVGCGDEEEKSSTPDSSSTVEDSKDEDSKDEDSKDEESSVDANAKTEELGEIDASLGKGGDTFNVVSWNADDSAAMIKQWEAVTGKKATFVNLNCQGGEATEKFNAKFKAGDNMDVYFVESDWALNFVNDDTKTVALEKLGFSDANFAEMYAFTDEIGKDLKGVRKGASWQAAAGGFAYRADLAEEYLGVKTPEEMQDKISDWTKFAEAAKTVADATDKKTALADSLGGIWQVFTCGRENPWVVDNKLQIDDSCKEFADLAKELWDNGGVTKNGQWGPDWLPAGQNDSAMGYFVSTWGFGDTILTTAAGGKDGASYGDWKICVGPQDYFWGGTWMVVPPTTDNAEEAQSFIATFTVQNDQIKEYALNKPEYCNNTVVMAEVIAEGKYKDTYVHNNLGGQNYFEVLDESVKGVDLEGKITPYDATIKSKFVEAVQKNYLEGGKTWDETVEAFKKDVKAAISTLEV